ncbi:histidine kinase [Prolixibacteraceae bacterium]|nr:histidine kinase [Prolixibacteraceae bacterium]
MKIQDLRKSFESGGYSKRIRITFHLIYTLGFLLIYVRSYSLKWPISFPFFFYRDIFEYGIISCFVYILYFLNKIKSPRLKWLSIVIGVLTMLVLLTIQSFFKNKELKILEPSIVIQDLLMYIGFGTVLFFIFILVDNLHNLYYHRYHRIEIALKEASNQLLRQQFHPHFMFNALNSIYSMSLNSNPNTADAILKLSGMMRFLTDDIHVRRIPISREVKFLKDYIFIEKIRFGEDADITLYEDGDLKNNFIEPLLLVTLVENAFKHGFNSNSLDAFVHMSISEENNIFNFSIRNSKFARNRSHEKRKGKGLINLQSRLELSYPYRHTLSIHDQHNQFNATLTIEL